MRFKPPLFALLAGLTLTSPALAQNARGSAAVDCTAAGGKAEAATPPDRNSRDGTAPGNAGSTGWSGGTGGSHTGTNPQGATQHSQTWHPPTARGLDPVGAPLPPKAC